MADGTRIEWADATWNPVTGCSVVSPGCTNCYAMQLAGTRLRHHPSRAGLTAESAAGPVWTGEVRFNGHWLDQPLRWRRPRRVFVCAHGDLFHEAVPDAWIDRVFAVMALAQQHVFIVLTKRAARMRAYMAALGSDDWCARLGDTRKYSLAAMTGRYPDWPLRNAWLGVSAEDQRRADERIPDLLATPAAARLVSLEPLLGPIDLAGRGPLDWVIAGGESGAAARPMHPDWARSLRDQCQRAGVPFFFKQWGEWAPAVPDIYTPPWHIAAVGQNISMVRVGKHAAGRLLDGREWSEFPA